MWSGVQIRLLWIRDFNLHFNLNRSSCPEVFCKKGVLRNFGKFTGKQNHSLIGFAYKTDCVSVSWLTNFCKGVWLFKPWLVHQSLVLLFYDIKKFTKVLLRSSESKIAHYYFIQSIPWEPNLKAYFCVFFITPLLDVFFLILLTWGCLLKFNLAQLLPIYWWRNLKSSFQLKRPD